MEQVYKSFEILTEMLHDRGIHFDSIHKQQIDEFIMNQSNKPGFEIIIGGSIRVVYYLSQKYKWSELKKMFDEDNKYELTILIVREKISQNNLKQLNDLRIPYQVFLLKELQFNISKHILVPKHQVIRDSNEIADILSRFCLKSKNQLPIIMKNDAMAKWLNLKVGDIVKITRPSTTSGIYESYRCCV